MPIYSVEPRKSQSWTIGSNGSASRVWHVFGTADITEVKTEVLAVAPTTWLSIGRYDAKIQIDEMGYQAWKCTVPYDRASPDPITPLTPPAVFSFRTSGGTQKITSAEVVNKYTATPGPATAPNFRGAILVDGKGNIEGVDFPAPIFDFEIEHYIAEDELTNSYLGTLVNLTAKTNNATFRGFAIGEVLYIGACGSQESGGRYRLTHSFKASPNKTGLSLAPDVITGTPTITGVAKKGWEFLWVYFKQAVTSDMPVMKPVAAYVHKMTTSGDFSLIGVET